MSQTGNSRQRLVKTIRLFRTIHRSTGILLFVFFFVIGITSALLGWKKHSDWLQLPTQQGNAASLKDWLPLALLEAKAMDHLKRQQPGLSDYSVERIDARPDKGIAKIVFNQGFWEVQVDAASGEVLGLSRRRADFIEHLHDGSIIDQWLGISKGWFKLVYTTVTGIALVLFTITGFWLWMGPRILRKTARQKD